MILTMALDSELTFWFIKQLFYCTLCLDSSLHRCIKVTNVSNKEKHDESYLIQFCLKDLLYACADTPLGKSGRKHRARGVADLCVTLSVLRQLLRLVTSVFFCWPLAVHRDWVWKALLTSNLSTWSHATAAWHSDEPDKRFHQFWAVNSHVFQIFINRYQQLPSPSTRFTFFYIYMPFGKDWKAWMHKKVNLSKRKKTQHNSALGKFKPNASTAGEEAAPRNTEICRQDALRHSYLSFWSAQIQDGPKSRNSRFTSRTSKTVRAEPKHFHFSPITKVCKMESWHLWPNLI